MSPQVGGLPPRTWLRRVHEELTPSLPRSERPALLTEDMVTDDGRAVDVHAYFGTDFRELDSLCSNLHGLQQSAQAAGAKPAIDPPPPPWPGFEQVWIPIEPELELSGRLGLVRDAAGRPVRSNCVVVLPGLLGDNAVMRTRDVGAALIKSGRHVLALELRGHGQTERRYPRIPYAYGVYDTRDLLRVAEWLQERPEVDRTGMAAFCWSSNLALLAAWELAWGAENDPITPEPLRSRQPRKSGKPVFEAGFLVFSPVLRFEEIMETLKQPQSKLRDPMMATLQGTVRDRQTYKGHADRSGNLRTLIETEFANAPLRYSAAMDNGLTYLRLWEFQGKPAGRKLARLRSPLVIVHGVNDPMADAQTIADLVATGPSPNLAAVILPGGSHVGFAPYSREYFYKLLLSFFDPRTGPGLAPNTSEVKVE